MIDTETALFHAQTVIGAIFILLTLLIALRAWNKQPIISFCILSYWAPLFPATSFLPFHHLIVDYRPYPSSVFLFLLLAYLAQRYLPNKAFISIMLNFIVFIAAASYFHNYNWRTEATLWTQSVKHGADATAHMNLAMSIKDRDDPRVEYYFREALRMAPRFALRNINLGLLLLDKNK
ncbi:MAG: hypothetical protein IT292_10705 [Deltaproteobacteria bacterium]|nr:hypothetical protein [Deltaproteobacteria bacterium]